ncbi:hypothetical protein D3C84_1118660 [compost metagenome]
MSPGQRLKIQVEGMLSIGGKETFQLRTGAAELVTTPEYDNGEIQATLPRAFLEKLKIDQQFDVSISVSFDSGATYKPFPSISPQLVD